MLDELWSLYDQSVYDYFFYKEHLSLRKKISWMLSFMPAFITLVGSSGIIFSTSSFGWIIVVLVGQVLPLVKELTNIQKQIWMLEGAVQKADQNKTNVTAEWRKYNSLSDEDLNTREKMGYSFLEKVEKCRQEIRCNYLSEFTLSDFRFITKSTDLKTSNFLTQKHGKE